jgi:hypothetical protein
MLFTELMMMEQLALTFGITKQLITHSSAIIRELIGTCIVILSKLTVKKRVQMTLSHMIHTVKMIGGVGTITTMIHTVTTAMIRAIITTIQIMGMEATAGITPTMKINMETNLIPILLMDTKNTMDWMYTVIMVPGVCTTITSMTHMEIIVITRNITTTTGKMMVMVTTHGTIPILEFKLMQMEM